jgi:hypothetical protein
VLHVKPEETSQYVRRALQHPALSTSSKRLGKVVPLLMALPSGIREIGTSSTTTGDRRLWV